MTSSLELSELLAAASRDANSCRRLQRLQAVPGKVPGRQNDVLLLRPDRETDTRSGRTGDEEPEGEEGRTTSTSSTTSTRSTSTKHVVFFHGDIQNFHASMCEHADCSPWLGWSLEHVIQMLALRFPGNTVWIVRASHFYRHKFSCYRNFVQSDNFGAPRHSAYCANTGAFAHLRSLLSNAMDLASLPNPFRPQGSANVNPPAFSLTLVGFSKGCVVLNQLLYELAGASADPQMVPLVRSISDMFWLDGGHPGGSDTWVTDREVLKQLAASGVSVHAHVTPYEVCDPARAWVGREHGCFISTLQELGAWPNCKLHFHDQPPSVLNHFRVLQEF